MLDFSDRTFGEIVGEALEIDVHSEKYSVGGTSKANKLRTIWKMESDAAVGRLLSFLLDYESAQNMSDTPEVQALRDRCRTIANRLLSGSADLSALEEKAKILNSGHLKDQIRRLQASVETDPSLAIGTAKEMIETCCRTILAERGKPIEGNPDLPALTKEVFKELNLVPDNVPDSKRGAESIKRLLSNLSTIANNLAELRNLYGTGHGKHGCSTGLQPRHAKLAVGAASALVIFLFETHSETK